jgi:hypothetical protein
MASDDEDASPTVASGKVMFEAIVGNESLGILAGVTRQAAEFGKLPPEMTVEAAEDRGSFFGRKVGAGEFQIAEAGAAQARDENPGDSAKSGASAAPQGTRQSSHDLQQGPGERVFQSFTHRCGQKEV